jgi:hypothetical protein
VADKKLKVDLEIATKQAQAELKATAKEAEKLGTELEDTESAGKQMAKVLSKVAADIETEFADAKSAAERLGEALGPEFSADAEKGEAAVMELVAQLRAAGLSYDDVRADADELATAIKQLDSAGSNLQGVKQGALDVEDSFKRVGSTADNTRSVVANFTGNAASELPGITSAMGPLNMAIGQFGEYAAEGNIKLGSFVKAAGGLAIVSTVLMGISKGMENIAEHKAWRTERVKAFREALKDSESTVEALASTYREAGKVVVETADTFRSINPFAKDTEDITAALASLGMTVDQFAALVAGGKPKIDEWGAAMLAAGVEVGLVEEIYSGARSELLKLSEAHAASAVNAQVFGQSMATTKQTADEYTESQKAQNEAIQAASDRMLEQAAILQEQADAQRAAADSMFALRDAEDDLTEKVLGANEAMKEADGDLRKVRAVLDDVTMSAADYADTTTRVWEEQAKANGVAVTGSQKQTIWNNSMIASAATMDGPLRESILEHIANVNGIPDEKVSAIRALLDQGLVDQAAQSLNLVSETRTAEIYAEAKTADAEEALRLLIRDRNANIIAGVGGRAGYIAPGARGATGGIVTRPTVALIGEAGPEAVVPLNRTPGSSPLPSGGGMNITINMPPGANGQDVVNAIKKYERTAGPGWRS